MELLQRWRQGDSRALDELMPLVYDELHRMAQAVLRNRSGQTLQPTALINEAYLKLIGGAEPQVADRAHFLAVMSRVMRHVLIDHIRTAGDTSRTRQLSRVYAPCPPLVCAPTQPQRPLRVRLSWCHYGLSPHTLCSGVLRKTPEVSAAGTAH